MVVGVGSLGTATHFSSFLSLSPSEAVVSSVSASAPVLVLLLAVVRLVVELTGEALVPRAAARDLSLISYAKREKRPVKRLFDEHRVGGDSYELGQLLAFFHLENREVKHRKT